MLVFTVPRALFRLALNIHRACPMSSMSSRLFGLLGSSARSCLHTSLSKRLPRLLASASSMNERMKLFDRTGHMGDFFRLSAMPSVRSSFIIL